MSGLSEDDKILKIIDIVWLHKSNLKKSIKNKFYHELDNRNDKRFCDYHLVNCSLTKDLDTGIYYRLQIKANEKTIPNSRLKCNS